MRIYLTSVTVTHCFAPSMCVLKDICPHVPDRRDYQEQIYFFIANRLCSHHTKSNRNSKIEYVAKKYIPYLNPLHPLKSPQNCRERHTIWKPVYRLTGIIIKHKWHCTEICDITYDIQGRFKSSIVTDVISYWYNMHTF